MMPMNIQQDKSARNMTLKPSFDVLQALHAARHTTGAASIFARLTRYFPFRGQIFDLPQGFKQLEAHDHIRAAQGNQ
ncbi:MAG: hypothetical protein A4E74_00882 [Syntrophus sp. PtaB.Bin075]|mgnify:CR=1 FL=1|nr:MAG: hypothetical protein A4E74_00882 [Syntrophus sp. PtaB.Bin075]